MSSLKSRDRAASDASSSICVGASHCHVLVLASQEDEHIARRAWALLA